MSDMHREIIEGLRAELAAVIEREQETVETSFKIMAERDKARAELAAEKKHTQVWAAEAGRWEAKFNEARAELANWKESYESSRSECVSIRAKLDDADKAWNAYSRMHEEMLARAIKAEYERDALREALREARPFVERIRKITARIDEQQDADELIDRIDAALNGGGDERK